MALKYEIVPVTGFQQNCSIIWCDKTHEAALVDPGGDVSKLVAKVNDLGVKVTKVLLTHGHLDHVGGTEEVRLAYNVPVIGPEKQDAFWLQALPAQSEMFGFARTEAFDPDQWLEDGDEVTIGESTLTVIHTPGHTPGHIVLFSEEDRIAWVGDVLFNGSIGRTDFPKGDHATLISSIKDKLFPLGNDITFVPGHGPTSTFGIERQQNPYVADNMPIW
ncbi:MBL fold metallo-hydrolase [Grimontia hollisae]|uniref:Hydroxyacylglutathione hydrolase n=2 Tax=Grimontia hollisae TaxID=673 RepID=D0IA28_GRIHO|nr:MBL fold metallo-hydrolase [Grimontia hollisae]AMG31735.1 MBL fold metallo-hydrolase [Grimontia hollisae]EEY70746.1 hydroxyacylglutathione hydrolase [Grimontia hollisae CIP 101886]MDF2186112.1 MBL fold metallo-hydrolase [Grimontia hollisae]STO44908.1 hydroxyacylglutathione hydrolase [Grimontia hollisae]STO57660.1 hydroxyacylglutathione hydrolase [Grimontia hollisae]